MLSAVALVLRPIKQIEELGTLHEQRVVGNARGTPAAYPPARPFPEYTYRRSRRESGRGTRGHTRPFSL